MYEFRHAFNISSLKESPSVSEDILCCRYSPDDTMICTSHYDGVFNCSNVHTGKLLYSLSSSKCNGTELQSTIPSFRFLPNYKDSKSGCVLLLSGSRISYWHVQTQQLLRAIDTTTSKSNTETRANALYTLDVHSNGSSFICAGKDRIIRSYDVERGVLIREASESENCESMAHSSRIQCVKWISSDTFVSAGWDSTLQFFDLRVGRSTCHVSGMYVSGESIDSISSHQLAVGCYNHESPVQVLDLRNFTKADLDWPKRKDPLSGDYETCKVIGLSSKPQFFVACGNRGFQLFNSTTQQLIRREDEDIPDSSYKPSDEVWFSCHMNHSGTSFVLGGKKSHVIIYDYYSHTNSKS